MAFLRNRLYGFSAAILLLPVMRMQYDNIGDYIRNLKPEFQTFVAEFIVSWLSAIVDSVLLSFTRVIFGY